MNATQMIWGLSLNETLLLSAIILIIIDFFIQTDLPTHVAYVLFSILIARNFEVHFMYKIIIGLVSWFLVLGFHYLFWKSVLLKVANRIIAPDRCKVGADALVDMKGEIKEIESHKMVLIKGDLWPYEGEEDLVDGDVVRIKSVKAGLLVVQLVERRK